MRQSEPAQHVHGYRELLMCALVEHGDKIVLSDERRQLSGNEVSALVEHEGERLRQAGCGPEVLVALKHEPGVDAILAILAVLASGAAYLPLDPRHGTARLAAIVESTNPDFVLDEHGLTARQTGQRAQPSNGRDDLAYVISTSGSTGVPKAAMIEQRGLVTHTQAMIELLELEPGAVVLQTAPPSFDIAVWQNTTGIVAGARTHVATPDERLDPRALWRVLIREQVTVTQLVPSMIRVMLDSAPPRDELSLKSVISTGEALDATLVNQWLATYPDLPLINMYGPAECSDDVSVHALTQPVDPRETIPIGRSFAGARLRVIDADGAEVAPGETGEIQVCGPVVGRGYRNDPERTAESFGTVELNGETLRSYDTGDLGYVDHVGLLRYVGRTDFQVKVRGNRVELGEIERAIAADDSVRTCVVTKFDDASDRLVAHIERDPSLEPDRAQLRNLAAGELPSYMVPSAFVVYDALPLGPNGKVDRAKLAAPTSQDRVADTSGTGRAASGEVEQLLAESWADLLDLDTVPVDADFFDLGGTSLLAVISIDDLSRKLGYEIPTRTLVTGGTIERIAAQVEQDLEAAAAMGEGTVAVVQIQAGDDAPPLFLYPGEAVSSLGMVDLARGIAPGRSVYVFEPSRPLDGEPGPSMQLLAQRCGDAIRSVAPTGPIHLAGFCMGGDVSWEIAAQRAEAGDPVASVLLLQTERDGEYPLWNDDVGRLRILLAKLEQRARFELATARVLGAAQRRSHVRHLVIGKLIAKFTMPVEMRLHRTGVGSRLGLRPSLRLRQHLWALVDRAAYADWTPAALECPVVVVRATDQPPLIVEDELLGWASTGSRNLKARAVQGYHWSFLHHPAVVELASVVSQELSNADDHVQVTHAI